MGGEFVWRINEAIAGHRFSNRYSMIGKWVGKTDEVGITDLLSACLTTWELVRIETRVFHPSLPKVEITGSLQPDGDASFETR